MKIKDILLYGADARSKLISGIEKLADSVSITMGPQGRNVIYSDIEHNPVVTKDGVSVANSIHLIDPVEDMGVKLVRQAASKTVSDAGDGTTTSIVLAREIIRNVQWDRLNNVANYKRGMFLALEKVEIVDEKYTLSWV